VGETEATPEETKTPQKSPPPPDPRIDIAARAMSEADAVLLTTGSPWPWERRSKTAKERFRKMAKAAIETLDTLAEPDNPLP
jgi:hypothetical protein